MSDARPDQTKPDSPTQSGATLGAAQSGFSLHGLSITDGMGPASSMGGPLPSDTGAFRLVRELGRGGMGVVYEAEEVAHGRRVALKVVAQRLGVSEEARERFEREARLAASISHPNCVFVFGAHQLGGQSAIAMELMSGRSLDDVIKAGKPVSIDTAVRWVIEACDGLAAAHSVGIVHRDIKPSNCFLTSDDHVKVGDFGLSRTLTADLGLTQSGAFIGTPFYASPEQIRGRTVDQRSDIYSLGATLFAVLTGRAPFQGSTLGDVVAQITTEAPPAPRSLRRDVPRGLERVILRTLEKDPTRRFADANALRHALATFAPALLEPGGRIRRFAAYCADWIAITLIAGAVTGAVVAVAYLLGNNVKAIPVALDGPTRTQVGISIVGFLYFALLEGRFGTTLGKRVLGLRVVDLEGRPPSRKQVLLRTLVIVAAIYWVPIAVRRATNRNIQLTAPLSIVLCLSMRRRNGWRGLHELASRSRVVEVPSTAPRRIVRDTLDPERSRQDSQPIRVGNYDVTGWIASTEDGPLWLGRDPRLDRSVWILARGTAPAMPRRESQPPSKNAIRLIETVVDGTTFDVYESVGGASLAEWEAARAPSWPLVAPLLETLLEEVERVGPVSKDRLWVDRSGRLRILEFSVRAAGVVPDPGSDSMRSVALAAAAILTRPGRGRPVLPDDMPARAWPVVERLLGWAPPFPTPAEARAALAPCIDVPTAISRRRRIVQTLPGLGMTAAIVSTLFPVMITEVTTGAADAPTKDEMWTVIAAVLGIIQVPRILLALILRGGLSLTLSGLRVARADGRPAGRWLCTLRSLTALSPGLIPLAGVAAMPLVDAEWPGFAAFGLYLAVYVAGYAWCIRRPARGPHDALVGTHLVRA